MSSDTGSQISERGAREAAQSGQAASRWGWIARTAWVVQSWAVALFPVALALERRPADIAFGIGMGAWVVRMLVDRSARRFPRSALTWWLVAWLLAELLSFQHSVDLKASIHGLDKLAKYAAIYFLMLATVRDWGARRPIVLGWLAALTMLVVDGAWQFWTGSEPIMGRPIFYTFDTIRRISATFAHAENLAIYLVSSIPLPMALALRGPRRWRAAMWVLSLACVAVLVMTWARGGVLAFLAQMALLAILVRRWQPLAIAAVMLGATLLAAPPAAREWAATQPTLLHKLAEPDRMDIWKAARNMIVDHPFVGVGVNTFVKAYPAYRIPGDRFAEIGPYAHNQYLQLTAELGVVGLSVFVGVLAVLVRCALARLPRRWDERDEESAITAGLLAGLAGYLVIGLLESCLFYGQASMQFWVLAALLIGGAAASGQAASAGATPMAGPVRADRSSRPR